MRSYPFVILVTAALAAARSPQAPQTCRYRIAYRGEANRVRVTNVGVHQEKVPFTSVALITVRLTDTVGGRSMDVHLDSLSVDPPSGTSPASGSNGKATNWHAFLTSDGRIMSVASGSISQDARPVDRLVHFLFPRVKSAARIGDSWADTTEWTTDRAGETRADQVVTNYTVARQGRDDYSGIDLLVVSAAWAGSHRASFPAGPDQVSLEGTSSGRAEYYVAASGCELGGWRAGTRSETSMAPAFQEPLHTSNSDSASVTLLR